MHKFPAYRNARSMSQVPPHHNQGSITFHLTPPGQRSLAHCTSRMTFAQLWHTLKSRVHDVIHSTHKSLHTGTIGQCHKCNRKPWLQQKAPLIQPPPPQPSQKHLPSDAAWPTETHALHCNVACADKTALRFSLGFSSISTRFGLGQGLTLHTPVMLLKPDKPEVFRIMLTARRT